MLNVTVNTSCKNSPKREFLKEWNVAFAKGNSSFVLENVSDDVTWAMVGDNLIEGKDAFEKAFEGIQEKATELILYKIVTHGKEGAVNGTMVMENGKHYAFCDVYEFTNTRGTTIKSIESYVIEIAAS